jgi:hypothetical protein
MSPRNDEMLVNEVIPRLRNAVHTIPKIGCEDDEEIVQDATLMAARMMESAERAGHPDYGRECHVLRGEGRPHRPAQPLYRTVRCDVPWMSARRKCAL